MWIIESVFLFFKNFLDVSKGNICTAEIVGSNTGYTLHTQLSLNSFKLSVLLNENHARHCSFMEIG